MLLSTITSKNYMHFSTSQAFKSQMKVIHKQELCKFKYSEQRLQSKSGTSINFYLFGRLYKDYSSHFKYFQEEHVYSNVCECNVKYKESFICEELRYSVFFSFLNHVFIEPEHDEVSWQCSNNGDFDACELMSF